MNDEKIRVLIADDNELFRKGLVSLLAECESIMVVGEASDGHQAIEKTLLLWPHVILMDVAMPHLDGITATQRILAEHPSAKVAMLTGSEDDETLIAAVRSGARSYLTKTVSLDSLESAIQITAMGGTFVSPQLARQVLDAYARSTRSATTHETAQLTPRELEVLDLIGRGATNQEIGSLLGIAESTAKVHVGNILGKLELRNRQQAAGVAVQEGLIKDVRSESLARH
jgi:DNA-binding NarL/FixJ family response regulator